MEETTLTILSGPSGSGKSTAIRVLEDMGYFCVDNLPVKLLPKFIELSLHSSETNRLAIVVDVREGKFLKDFPSVLKQIRGLCCSTELIYLESSDETLVRRFSETRRRHPLAPVESPAEGISKERELLKDIKECADTIIDTSCFNVHELKSEIRRFFSEQKHLKGLVVNLTSFGYRYGVPRDAEIVMDVRFIANPYFVDELRALDGRDLKVRDFVVNRPEAEAFMGRFSELIDFLLPLYIKEGKSYLSIAIGCTAGRHRSVAVVDTLKEVMNNIDDCVVRKTHRDADKTDGIV